MSVLLTGTLFYRTDFTANVQNWLHRRVTLTLACSSTENAGLDQMQLSVTTCMGGLENVLVVISRSVMTQQRASA